MTDKEEDKSTKLKDGSNYHGWLRQVRVRVRGFMYCLFNCKHGITQPGWISEVRESGGRIHSLMN